jgi:hypothetical protein
MGHMKQYYCQCSGQSLREKITPKLKKVSQLLRKDKILQQLAGSKRFTISTCHKCYSEIRHRKNESRYLLVFIRSCGFFKNLASYLSLR